MKQAETHNEFIQQCINAVDRAKDSFQATAQRCTTPDDPYGGLMWADDADTLAEAITALRSLLLQEDTTQVAISIGTARVIATRLSYNSDLEAKAKHLLLELASACAARMVVVHHSDTWNNYIVEDGLRRTRPMTNREKWLWRFFGVKPERV